MRTSLEQYRHLISKPVRTIPYLGLAGHHHPEQVVAALNLKQYHVYQSGSKLSPSYFVSYSPDPYTPKIHVFMATYPVCEPTALHSINLVVQNGPPEHSPSPEVFTIEVIPSNAALCNYIVGRVTWEPLFGWAHRKLPPDKIQFVEQEWTKYLEYHKGLCVTP